MNWLEIAGAALYFIGFCLLFPWEDIADFLAFIRNRADAYAKLPHGVKHAAWSEKWRPFLGLLFLFFGSVINLVWVIIK